MKLNGFDAMAGIYDQLAWLVFRDAILKSQTCFLGDLPSGKVLILGGGSGSILKHILEGHEDAEIWYIEASDKMIQLAKKKTDGSSRIHFVHGTEDSIPAGISFDAVITPFYLDLFTTISLQKVVGKIDAALHPGTIWLATDFVDCAKLWQRIMLASMYAFFRFVADLQTSNLPDWNAVLKQQGWLKAKSTWFYGHFIEAAVFTKTIP